MQSTSHPDHVSSYRVYYEDTDAGGIVYYANYLKFAERARTDWLRSLGISQSELADAKKIGFVVRRVEADFLAPARLDDILVIETCLQEAGKVRMKMVQAIKRGNAILAQLQVIIACVKDGKPVKIPENIRLNK